MKRTPIHALAAAAIPALISAAMAPSAAAAELHVFSTGAPSVVLKVLAETFTRDSGDRITFTVGTPGELQKKLAAAATPDVVVMPAPVIERLEKAGTLQAGSRVDLARVGVGIVVREGAPLPDISSVEAVRRVLLEARTIVHTDPNGSGFAGKTVARMIEQMGIAEAVKPKITIMQAIDGGVALVAEGKAEIGMFNVSEILPVKGVVLVGPLPAGAQRYIIFASALHSANKSPGPAQSFVRFVTAAAARAAWKHGGMEAMGSGT